MPYIRYKFSFLLCWSNRLSLYNGSLTLLCLHPVQTCINVCLNRVFVFCYPYILG